MHQLIYIAIPYYTTTLQNLANSNTRRTHTIVSRPNSLIKDKNAIHVT